MTALFVLGDPPVMPAEAIALANARDADGYFLHWRAGQFFLCDNLQRHAPLSIDFAGKNYHTRRGEEFLPKTLRGLAGAHVADATAGWAKDGWLLAERGFTVTLYERQPYLFYLLADALARARANPVCADVAARLSLVFADAATTLPPAGFDAVYLDPMYPARRKNAKVKKTMQALQFLLGEENRHEAGLLTRARQSARQRVIVKRPHGAPFLADSPPNYSIESPNTRYDVYLSEEK